jgi:hypothetical protein
MVDFLTAMTLAARRNDIEGWVQVLVFIMLAVFYVLGSILKARSKKAGQEGEEESAQRQIGKPSEGVKGLKSEAFQRPGRAPRRQYRPEVQPPRRRAVRAQPAARRLAVKVERATRPPTIKPREVPEVSPPRPQLEPKLEELPEFTSGLDKEMKAERLGIPAEIARVKYLGEPLLDYSDPDKLRRAILHYEILGKPLSLRGPGEQIIGL